MSTHGIWKTHHAAQTDQARKDWMWLADYAASRNVAYADLAPAAKSSWRKIERQIAKLKGRIRASIPNAKLILPSEAQP